MPIMLPIAEPMPPPPIMLFMLMPPAMLPIWPIEPIEPMLLPAMPMPIETPMPAPWPIRLDASELSPDVAMEEMAVPGMPPPMLPNDDAMPFGFCCCCGAPGGGASEKPDMADPKPEPADPAPGGGGSEKEELWLAGMLGRWFIDMEPNELIGGDATLLDGVGGKFELVVEADEDHGFEAAAPQLTDDEEGCAAGVGRADAVAELGCRG